MDFSLSAGQQRWHDGAVEFAREQLTDDLNDRDDRCLFWNEGWKRCAAFGLQGLPVTKDFGGQGLDLPETIAAMEGLGYGCRDNGLIMALNACLWTVVLPVARFGTDAQKQRYLTALCSGDLIGANCASEPEAGSDIFSMTARAELRDDGTWLVNGRKTWVTAGPIADLFTLYAVTDPGRGILGISAFLVEKGTPGFRVVREIPKMGLRTVPMGELAFEDCVLPADSLLGRRGWGAQVFNASMEWERGSILAAAVGTMRRQLEMCIEHARKRNQFGKPIGKFQSVSNRIVDMKIRLETCRPLVYKIGWLRSQGQDATQDAALAKLHVSESYVQNSLDSVRIFGASGYTNDLGLERELRDSVGSLIFSGTNDIQRVIIAQGLRI
jgi:alkylation response protein AidB-like acyl-CoA dehydrogenase